MKRVLVILGLATLGGAAILAYGLWGPFYAVDPLQAPLSLSTRETQQFPFRVGRSASYFVEVHLKQALPESEMERFIGDSVAGGGGAGSGYRFSC